MCFPLSIDETAFQQTQELQNSGGLHRSIWCLCTGYEQESSYCYFIKGCEDARFVSHYPKWCFEVVIFYYFEYTSFLDLLLSFNKKLRTHVRF